MNSQQKKRLKEIEGRINDLTEESKILKAEWSSYLVNDFEATTGLAVGAIVINKDDEKQSAEGRMRNGKPLIVRKGVIERIVWQYGLSFPFIFVRLFNKDGYLGVMEQKIDRYEWRIYL